VYDSAYLLNSIYSSVRKVSFERLNRFTAAMSRAQSTAESGSIAEEKPIEKPAGAPSTDSGSVAEKSTEKATGAKLTTVDSHVSIEYVSGKKLALVLAALYMSIFLVALVRLNLSLIQMKY
jgi:hypothetical protein